MQSIKSTVENEAGKLVSPATLSSARKNLIDEADTGTNTASGPYQHEYATKIDQEMGKIVFTSKVKTDRLNAAIVLGNVAKSVSRTNNAVVFAGTAKKMLTDPDWTIVYWGMKVARYALADEIQAGAQVPLTTTDVEVAVKANPNSAEVIEEAYQVLTLEPIPRGNQNFGTLMLQTLPTLLNIIDWRTSLYKTAVPVVPTAEIVPATLLPVDVFSALTTNKQLESRTLKSLSDLANALLTAWSNLAPQPDASVVAAAQGIGNALSAFGTKLNDQSLQAAGQAVWKLNNSAPQTTVAKDQADLTQALTNLGVPAPQ